MKVVLDTNVFISGLFWDGFPHKIIILAEQQKILIHASAVTLEELFSVLQRDKFKPLFVRRNTTVQDVVAQVLAMVCIESPVQKVQCIKDDPDDNHFLDCALVAKADFIVSGDKHLLVLKSFRGIPIVTSRTFVRSYNIAKGM